MDDYDEEEAPEAPSEEEQPSQANEQAMTKLKKENQSLRQRLRRSELEGNFGKDVVDLIPEELPISKWEDFATKLSERLPKPQEPDQTSTPPEAEAQEPEPAGLAAVAKGPAPGTAVPEELMTVSEIKELGKTDPQRANDLIRQGKFIQQTEW